MDATVIEEAIRFPTDLSLLNESREISEYLIDELYQVFTDKKTENLLSYRPQSLFGYRETTSTWG